MDWKPDMTLSPDQHANPILDYATIRHDLPEVGPDFFEALWGPGRSRRLKTWGRAEGTKDGPGSAHYLALRAGTNLHTDPAFARYSVQLQLYNDGYMTHGLEDWKDDPDAYPIMERGVVVLLDTHSPHKVIPDPRVEQTGHCKLTAAIDYWELPDMMIGLEELLVRIQDPPVVPA